MRSLVSFHRYKLYNSLAYNIYVAGKPLPGTDLMTVSVSHRHIIISFLTGADGGFSQTITLQYRTSSEDFRDADLKQYNLNYQGRDELELRGLGSNTAYSIRLVSDSECPDGTPPTSDVITVTTRGKSIFSQRISGNYNFRLRSS